MLTLAMMFKDGMVLQRDRKVAVWGMAEKNVPVTLTMQGKTFSAAADEEGKFRIEAGPFETSFSEEMTVSSGTSQITLKNVMVGEVWYAGGQSNMEFYMRYDKGLEEEKKQPNPNIRFFDYPEVSYVGELKDADYSEYYGFWRKADPEDLQWWNAVPYYFAKDLYAKYQVPVGIVGCNWGGTKISCWMPEDVLREAGGQFILDEYQEQIKNLDLDAYNKAFAANPMSFRTNQLTGVGQEMQDWIMSGDYGADMMMQMGRRLAAQGVDVSKIDPSSFVAPMGPKHERRPCGLYYSMVREVAPYTVRGIIWYQGESDGDSMEHAKVYRQTFSALIAHYRKLWDQPELPFLFVQIAPYEKWMVNTGTNYGIIRKAQKEVADAVENTGMAVITDAGMRWDIHPIIKSVVGHRLALQAENKVYGEQDVFCESPVLTGVRAEDGKAVLTFANCGNGLHLTEETLYGNEIPSGTLQGVKLLKSARSEGLSVIDEKGSSKEREEDGQFIRSEDCQAEVVGNEVILTSPAIKANEITGAAVADDIWYQINLYNSADIPAQPAEVSR